MISKTSTGVNFLGIPSVVMYMEQILKIYPKHKKKIISIGSGGGYVEKVLDKLLDIDILCIDPDPLSYITEKVIYKHPKYKTIDDSDFPLNYYKNDCILFLNWPDNEQRNGYDIMSILKLNPFCILTIVETGIYRGAGSIGFHNFLAKNGIITGGQYNSTFDDCEKPENIELNTNYNYTMTTTCYYKRIGYSENLEFRIILLEKKTSSVDILPSIVKPYNSPENMNDNDMFNYWWIPIRKRIEPLINKLKILPADADEDEDADADTDADKKKIIDSSWNEYIEEIINSSNKTKRKSNKKVKRKQKRK